MNVVIDFDNKAVRDEQKFYEVIGYSETLGVMLSADSLDNYRKGYTLTQEQEDTILNIYLQQFGKSK